MQTNINAIVLSVDRYRTNKFIITIICPEFGKLKAFITISKSSLNAMIEQGHFINVTGRLKKNEHFLIASKYEIIARTSFAEIGMEKWLWQNFFCELLLKTNFDDNASSQFFQYAQFVWFNKDYNLEEYKTVLLYFLWHYIADIGCSINYQHCKKCLRPSYKKIDGELKYVNLEFQIDYKSNCLICQNCQPIKQSIGPWFIKFINNVYFFKLPVPKDLNSIPTDYQKQILVIFNNLLYANFSITLNSYQALQ